MPKKSTKPIPAPGSWAATLKGWRKHNGLTQQAAADLLKVRIGTYQQWEYESRLPTVLTPEMMMRILDHVPRD